VKASVRRVLLLAAVLAVLAALRDILLRRNEARYGGPNTPYGPG
jgi:hypothetical protein